RYAVLRHCNEKEIRPSVEMGTIHVMSYNNNMLSHFYQNDFLESPRHVILRSGVTKNLSNIRFFAIAQNDKIAFSRLFTEASTFVNCRKG
ncbi:MAG: hypothetical protein B1H13_03345, partial [Desulfobacteraceae bacterium 4484_190.3]